MRSLLYAVLSLATVATTLAAEAPAVAKEDSFDDLEEKRPDTVFNGQTVPPFKDLTDKNIKDEIAKGNWLVEFYSPLCWHCNKFKPVWQTLYEFYYTSKPVPSAKDKEDTLNSFTRWYDFKFARLDCITFKDTCEQFDVTSYPTIKQFKDGQLVDKKEGFQTLEDMSSWVEQILETIRPGSRTKGGPKLPEVGANAVKEDDPKAAASSSPDSKDKPKDTGKVAETLKEGSPSAKNTASATLKAVPSKVTKAKVTANPSGVSVNLDAAKFQKLVTNTIDPWFIKFYAPWCHHCQAMAPNWAQMAREMKGKLNIGEVNCDIEKRLCKDAHVRGYPTILFFRAGERIEYEGLRGIGDLIDYASKAADVTQEVPDVDATTFEKMEETEEVIFLYIYDHATVTEDFQALNRLTVNLIGKAKLVKSSDPKLADRFKISTWPRLLVSRDGKPSYYPALAPKDMRDQGRVTNWMKTVWLPLVPELTATNAHEIMDGKLVVLGILNRDRSDEFIIAKREIKTAAIDWIDRQTQMFKLERQELRDAKQLRIEEADDRNDQRALRSAKSIRINMEELERKRVGFAWVDGLFWERWIRTTYGIDVKDGEKVIINDEANHRYWDVTMDGNPIRPSRTSILETISKVYANPPKISPKSTTGTFEHIFFVIRKFSGAHPYVLFAVGFVLSIAIWIRTRHRRRAFGNTGGFFQLDGKEGLLGGNSGGKND